MKKKRSRVRNVIGFLLLIPVVLLGFIQTPPGKEVLANGLSSVLSRSENLEVRIGTIKGWIPGKVTIGELEVGDAKGIWLSAKNLHCRWMMQELFEHRIHLSSLSADEVVWSRFPSYGKRDSEKRTSKKIQLWELQLNGLSVETFKLEKGVASMPLDYTVHSGGIGYMPSGALKGTLNVSGDAQGEVELDAMLAGSESDELKITAILEEMTNPTFGLDRLSGRGEALIKKGTVTAVITAELDYADQPGRLATRLQYSNRQLSLQQLQYSNADFGLSGDLSLGFTNRMIDIALDTTFVDASTNQFGVRGNAVFAQSNKTWGVNIQDLEVRGWEALSMNISGLLSPEQAALTGILTEIDVAMLPLEGGSNFTGRVTGEVQITGPLDSPRVIAGLKVGQFTSVQEAFDELPELDFQVSANLADGTFAAETSITNYAKGHLQADFSMPCEFSLIPFRYSADSSKIDLCFDANLALNIFNQLAFFQDQYIDGVLKAKVTYEDRAPSGFLRVENGRYEHYSLGIVFQDFNADFVATAEGFEVNQAQATDGAEGSVTMTGGLRRSGLDLNLELSNAWIFRREEADAQISGNIKVQDRLFHPRVSGELTINEAEILLDNIAPEPPPVLTDFDLNATTNTVAVLQGKRKTMPVGLDVRILMPDQIFVNASMIEAVLGGSLHITDTKEGIAVSGKIEPRRGFVNFIGKKFRFTDGHILLDGSVPTMAVLADLTAEYSRQDVTARLVLSGPANDPRFRLESTPAMPEDEVLSHVLFNRDTSSISPYQAYQITMAARQLSGGLNGPGFMFQIRKAIGIDTLEWREADAAGGASSVAAGKYITSGLYVEVNQSLDDGGETGMMAELEVTRHFSVETYTGPKMRPGIGVNWRNDY